ncbi:endonuclease [Duganella sp. FT50W]|uniref:Endonuclease n=1 Tax=Duganella lactea TaxID=2692173 RepID=A0A6L8MEA8_9BURK|nr:YqaJ viral recombinase family protein [Duganella lactea]MYM81133.1 endonuclease [Duganella lactea]
MQRDPNIHREIHDLLPGTPEWHAFRADHYGASEAPAMIGCSPYKTRTELIRERATGIKPEVDAFAQKRFDDGHKFEALARPLAETIIGMDLYPVTASLGKMSASFDGLTMCETVVWEHKTLNDQIRACETAADLPLVYRVQMEQQVGIVSAEKALFSATRWDDAGNLLEEKHMWYAPDLALRAKIIAGWEQFEIDVANYTPAEPEVKHVAAPALALPALVIRARGEVVQSNLPAFKAGAEQFLANIKTVLETDEDFIEADQAVKDCEKAEANIEQAKKAVIAEMASVDDVLRVADQVKELIRARRLTLTSLIDAEKKNRRETIVNEGKRDFLAHVAKLDAEIAPLRLPHQVPDFAGAAKGKRTIKGLQDAVSTTLANGKVAASQTVADIRAKLAWFSANVGEHRGLFSDLQQIIVKASEDFQLIVTSRIDKKKADDKAKEDALREQIAAQEQAKAEAAAAAKLAAERQADADRAAAAAQAERERVAAAEKAERDRVAAATKAQLEQKAAAAGTARQHTVESALAAANRLAAQDRAGTPAPAASGSADVQRTASFYNDQPLRAAPVPAAATTSDGLFDAADRETQQDIEFLTSLASAAGLPLAVLLDRLVVIDIATLRAELRAAA